MMTRTDKEDIQLMFDKGIANINQIIDLKLINIEDKLDATIVQTTKTNGTVIKHGEQIQAVILAKDRLEQKLITASKHFIEDCAQKTTIEKINDKVVFMEDNMITIKGLKRVIIGTITIVSLLTGAIFTILNYFYK